MRKGSMCAGKSKKFEMLKLKLNDEKTTVRLFSRYRYEDGEKKGVFHHV